MPPGTKIFDPGWVLDNLDQIGSRIGQHLVLTIFPLLIGIGVALILSIIAIRRPRTYSPITAISGLLYTIPSLAAFAVLRPIFGLSLVTAFIPLATYTLLILFRNFTAGFYNVPKDILEAAEGMGYTRRERLLRVELPLSVPLIISGIRLATVTTIGLATVVAVLGDSFGGLGQLITEGIQTFFPTKYLLGAILSVGLAVTADVLLVRLERWMTPWAHAKAKAR
jgi:osmoprotectant transport system permease protein